jgi:hypothetical protein
MSLRATEVIHYRRRRRTPSRRQGGIAAQRCYRFPYPRLAVPQQLPTGLFQPVRHPLPSPQRRSARLSQRRVQVFAISPYFSAGRLDYSWASVAVTPYLFRAEKTCTRR